MSRLNIYMKYVKLKPHKTHARCALHASTFYNAENQFLCSDYCWMCVSWVGAMPTEGFCTEIARIVEPGYVHQH